MRFVPTQGDDYRDLQPVHRARDRWVAASRKRKAIPMRLERSGGASIAVK